MSFSENWLIQLQKTAGGENFASFLAFLHYLDSKMHFFSWKMSRPFFMDVLKILQLSKSLFAFRFYKVKSAGNFPFFSKSFATSFLEYNKDNLWQSLREKSPYSEFFCSAFSHIRTEYEETWSMSPYSVQMWENTDQKNFEYGYFLRSESLSNLMIIPEDFLS